MPLARLVLVTLALCALGGLGGFAASLLPLPLPWLLGSLAVTAALTMLAPRAVPPGYGFPQRFRVLFIAIIGLLIGAQVDAGSIESLPALAISLAAVTVFVPLAFALNYRVFRRFGGYDHATAFYSAAPGGLIEAITMGEAAGADIPRLVTQQFLRIVAVIGLVPMGLSLYEGHPVGSASGAGFSAPGTPVNWMFLFAALALGIGIGRLLRLPAWQLTGALLVSAALSLWGQPLTVPAWLVKLAQVVVGTSLGMRFAGLNRATLLRGVWLSLVSVTLMLALGAVLAALILPFTGQEFEVLLITFAPGGVNEMALVALSLHANPAFVTLHHVYRITITVFALGLMKRWLARHPGAT